MPDKPPPSRPDLDLAPRVGIATDVARLGSAQLPPAHELTADQDDDIVNWSEVVELPEFRSLLRAKARFLVPTTIFFIVYYFALPVLVGWFPDLMRTRVGPVNLAYAFALSQFFMAWTIAFLYVRRAARFDAQADAIVAKVAPAPADTRS